MHANAVNLHVLAVQEESFFGIETEGTYTCSGGVSIGELAIDTQFRFYIIQVRIVYVPKVGIAEGNFLIAFRSFTRGHAYCDNVHSNFFPVRIQQAGGDFYFDSGGVVILNGRS